MAVQCDRCDEVAGHEEFYEFRTKPDHQGSRRHIDLCDECFKEMLDWICEYVPEEASDANPRA